MINIHYSRLPGLPASRAARPGNPARLSRALAEDIDLLNLPAKRPQDPKDLMFLCAGKAIGESNVKLADEQKLVDNLPTYVCDNPDDMSFRLYDGELNVIMRKLNDVNIKIVEYSSVLAAIGQQVCAIQMCSQPVSSRMTAPPPRPDVRGDSDRTLIDRNTGESLIETTAGIPQPVPGDSESNTDWATINFTCRNRFTVLSTVTEDNMDGDQFTIVQSRRAAKHAKQQSSSPSHSSSQLRHQQQQRQPSRKSMLLGKAATGRSSALSAAKSIRKKAVFCIDNVSTSCCVYNTRAFVPSQSIDVLTF